MRLVYRLLYKRTLQRCCATIDVHKDYVLWSFFSERLKERSDFQREGLEQPRPLMTSAQKTTNRTFLVGFSFSGVRLHRLRSSHTKQYRLDSFSISFKNFFISPSKPDYAQKIDKLTVTLLIQDCTKTTGLVSSKLVINGIA